MLKFIVKFINNDIVFWIFFLILTATMISYVLKKEDIKITITFSKPYNNKVVTISGDE